MAEPEDSYGNRTPGRGWAVAGIVVGALAFVLIPFLLGPLGILFGLVGHVKGAQRLGKVAIGVSVFSLVLGSVLYIVLRGFIST